MWLALGTNICKTIPAGIEGCSELHVPSSLSPLSATAFVQPQLLHCRTDRALQTDMWWKICSRPEQAVLALGGLLLLGARFLDDGRRRTAAVQRRARVSDLLHTHPWGPSSSRRPEASTPLEETGNRAWPAVTMTPSRSRRSGPASSLD